MSDEVRRYVPACLQRISPPHWVRAKNAKTVRQAYRIIKEVEDHLPFPLPEPREAMSEASVQRRRSPVEFMGRAVKGGKISPSTVRKRRDGEQPVTRRRVKPEDIKVVRVEASPKAKAAPPHSYRRLPKCYIGDVLPDGTYQYGPGRQPNQARGPASEAVAPTLDEWADKNQRDFDKWAEASACSVCGEPIAPERLAAIPDTTVCVSCTTAKKVLGTMVPSNGKCGMTLQLVAGEDKAGQELLRKQVKRTRHSG